MMFLNIGWYAEIYRIPGYVVLNRQRDSNNMMICVQKGIGKNKKKKQNKIDA